MKDKQETSAISWHHFFWRVLTIVLFVYLCVDVSVLEYFCGNPSLGIISYRQIIEIKQQPTELSEAAFVQNSVDDSRLPDRDREPNIPLDGDDCFCCGSHTLIGGAILIDSLSAVAAQHHEPVFSNRQDHSDWHLPPFYHPPRTA